MSDTSQAPKSVVDPGILEMGASVSVNDEIRRTITAETVEIESICNKLASDVTIEEDRSKEMSKSKHYANTELSSIIQSTNELLETNQMNNHIFRGLQSKVEKDIILTSPPTSKPNNSDINHDSVSTTNENLSVEISPTSVFVLQQSNQMKQEDIQIISKKLRESTITAHRMKKDTNKIHQDTQKIYVSIKEERLKVALANAKHTVRLAEDIYHDKQVLYHTMKTKCEAKKGEIDASREALVIKEEKLKEKKRIIADLERDIKNAEAAHLDKVDKMTKQNDDLKQEHVNLDRKIAQLSEPMEEGRKCIQERELAKHRLIELRNDRNISYTAKTDLQSKLTSLQNKLDHNEQMIQHEKDVAEKVENLKATNDAFDFDVKNMELEEMIAQQKSYDEILVSKTYPEKENLVQSIEDKKAEFQEMKDSINRIVVENEEKRSTVKEYKRLLDDHCDGYENEFAKLQAQVTEGKETYAALQRQMKESNAVKGNIKNDLGLVLRNAKLYKYALKLLKNSKDKEAKLVKLMESNNAN